MHRSFYYYIVAAATIAIAGILHLIWASSIIVKAPPAISIFIVSGLAQAFWALPTIKRWGRKWYYIGLAGTVILVILYAATRVPNPLTGGRPAPTNEIGISILIFEIAYVAITATILVREKRMKKVSDKEQLR